MDWYPLYNSVRIALLSTAVIFFLGIAAAYYVARLPRALKGVLDAVLTLPLVLPADRCRLSAAARVWAAPPVRRMGDGVLGRQADDDMVLGDFRDGLS